MYIYIFNQAIGNRDHLDWTTEYLDWFLGYTLIHADRSILLDPEPDGLDVRYCTARKLVRFGVRHHDHVDIDDLGG